MRDVLVWSHATQSESALYACRYGKTVCGLAIAAARGIKTLVLVHKTFLVQQWQDRAATFLPTARIGRIQQNIVNVDADIVVGMIQSISKRDYASHILDGFGLVIIDEVRHAPVCLFQWFPLFVSRFRGVSLLVAGTSHCRAGVQQSAALYRSKGSAWSFCHPRPS